MKIKLSDYIWNYISNIGVKHVFMFPGGGAMHLVDSLGRNNELEYVTLLHEQACAIAAETYARIDYNLGVALVTTGPGGTNAVTGVAAAWLESTPMLVISGQVKTADLKKDLGVRQKGNQEIGIVDIVKSITKYAVTIEEPNDMKYHLDKALYEARQGRPGPVWLDIPLDVQAAMVDVEQMKGYKPPITDTPNKNHLQLQVMQTIQLLKDANRPVIIAGQGIERNNGKEVFRKLVDYLKIPVLTSWIAVELLEYENTYNMGKPGMVAPRYANFTMQNADLLIVIGSRLDPSMIGYNPENFAPKAKKIIVDIDVSEINKFSFPIEHRIVGDATEFTHMLLDIMLTENIKIDVSSWVQQCRNWKQKYPLILEQYTKATMGVNMFYFIDKLSDILGNEDVIIPGSSGAGIDVFWMAIKNKLDQRMLATGSLGSMGYGIPASIGACLALGKRTICVEGDGSCNLNIQEFASIKGMNLPIKIFVLNNGGYLSIMNMQKTHFQGAMVGAEKNSHLYLPDISKIAESYGFKTYQIKDHDKMEMIIKECLETEGPALCEVFVDASIAIQPKVMSKVQEDGSMVSGTLEDLWPFLSREELEENMMGEA